MGKIRFLRAIQIVKRNDDRKGFVVLPRRWVVERTFSWFGRNRQSRQDCEDLAETLAAFVTLALHPASPQAACRDVGRKLNNHGWQRTMTKVGKSDGEGTFPGTRDNDEVAPIPDLSAPDG
jgi:Transposase DDE domain